MKQKKLQKQIRRKIIMRAKSKYDALLEELFDTEDSVQPKKVRYQKNFEIKNGNIEVLHDEDDNADGAELAVVGEKELQKIKEEFGYRHNYLPDSKVVSFYDAEGNETFHTPSQNLDTMGFTLSEAYFGKKVTEEAFMQFCIVREKFKNAKYSPKMDLDPDVIKFNRAVEKTFGFTTFSLSISPDFSFNAYAIPIYTYLSPANAQKVKSSLLGGNGGFKFSDYGKIVALSTMNLGAIDSNLSNEELFAVMLHEIGHMFFEAVVDPNGIYNSTSYVSNVLSKVNGKIYEIISTGKKSIDNNEIIRDIDNIVAPFISKIVVGLTNIKNVIAKPLQGVFSLYRMVKGKVFKEGMFDNMNDRGKISYTNEKFADTFAAMYGYGPELHAALLKAFKNYEENNVPKKYAEPKGFIAKALCFADIMYNDYMAFLLNLKDEHPDGLTRINVGIQYLSKEISKDNIDPKMKKELIDQLNNLKKQIEDYIAFNNTEGDTLSVTRSYYIYLYKKFGGDRRETQTDNEALFDTIDKMLNTLKNSK